MDNQERETSKLLKKFLRVVLVTSVLFTGGLAKIYSDKDESPPVVLALGREKIVPYEFISTKTLQDFFSYALYIAPDGSNSKITTHNFKIQVKNQSDEETFECIDNIKMSDETFSYPYARGKDQDARSSVGALYKSLIPRTFDNSPEPMLGIGFEKFTQTSLPFMGKQTNILILEKYKTQIDSNPTEKKSKSMYRSAILITDQNGDALFTAIVGTGFIDILLHKPSVTGVTAWQQYLSQAVDDYPHYKKLSFPLDAPNESRNLLLAVSNGIASPILAEQIRGYFFLPDRSKAT